eukprot:Gregarina_sp_Poly_1__5572@NODE_2940_length_1526_cov_87_067169_g680_i4_p1_GENE_NODE_2940_length_1526_cov_87_067169_g680_i4NODE_2940_length_1526_cov_87_067169_g680_i4_p1_ORF_typecomplete_len104_score3_64_NODE_2940_length_1526_cov_87_067169_g680_i411381449
MLRRCFHIQAKLARAAFAVEVGNYPRLWSKLFILTRLKKYVDRCFPSDHERNSRSDFKESLEAISDRREWVGHSNGYDSKILDEIRVLVSPFIEDTATIVIKA